MKDISKIPSPGWDLNNILGSNNGLPVWEEMKTVNCSSSGRAVPKFNLIGELNLVSSCYFQFRIQGLRARKSSINPSVTLLGITRLGVFNQINIAISSFQVYNGGFYYTSSENMASIVLGSLSYMSSGTSTYWTGDLITTFKGNSSSYGSLTVYEGSKAFISREIDDDIVNDSTFSCIIRL